MKRIFALSIIFLFITLLLPSTAFAKEVFDDKVVFGGTYTLDSGETHTGSIVVLGGAVTIEQESTVNGDVVLLGGTVDIAGNVFGNVVGIGGAVRLKDKALVKGDLFTLGAALRRDDGSQVEGQVVNGINIPANIDIPGSLEDLDVDPSNAPKLQTINNLVNPFLKIVWFFFRIFIISALSILLVMFLPSHVEKVRLAALSQPVISVGAGLLTAILAPLALLVITITIILIPVTIISIILLLIAILLGWVALGTEIGKRISDVFKIEWAPAISAGVGTFVLLFVFGGIRELIPCIGWIPQTLVGLWGLGAVLLTRFGTFDFSKETVISSDITTSSSSEEKVESSNMSGGSLDDEEKNESPES
jgi:hypothetical protein